jgi:hypothetical protein
MTPHQGIAVALRVFAIWLALTTMRSVSGTFFGSRVDHEGLIAAGVIAFLTFMVALLLWFFPLTISKKLLSSPAATPAPTETPDTWLAMGCALIGLWLLASAIPSMVRDALFVYSSSLQDDELGGYQRWLVYRFVEVALALWLIAGTRGIIKVFSWLRNAGTGKTV